MERGQLAKLAAKFPPGPGVYFFKDRNGKNIYIGKASSLKSRISSYPKTEDQRIKRMIEMASSIKFVRTESDIEALILESKYIKKQRPMFNVVMRDDKQYFYVVITKEDFPKIFWTHQPQDIKFKGYTFIGPFTDGGVLKSTLRFLRRLFPYCTCKKPHNNFCLNYHIGKCLGYCCLKNNDSPERNGLKKDYRKNIFAIKYILEGKRESLIKNLEKEMRQLAKNDDLEGAIEFREKIAYLKRIFQNAKVIKTIQSEEKALSGLKNILNLPQSPSRIECYDISNIQGQNASGSMIVFENGRPNKNEYRKFKIRTVYQASDTDMLKEVLFRRFNHPEWPHPDLIIIDGGKGQLSAANSIVGRLKIPTIALTKNIDHKGQKITLADKFIPLSDLEEDVKNLILAIDSEAHRFAVNYYRKLHRKRIV